MENYYYLYFINLDNTYCKFGITQNIIKRLSRHEKKFVNKLKLKEYLDLKNIIIVDKEIICRELEKNMKKFIKSKNYKYKIYDETEIILSSDREYFIYKMINDFYNLNNYFEINSKIYVTTHNMNEFDFFDLKLCNPLEPTITKKINILLKDVIIFYEKYNIEIKNFNLDKITNLFNKYKNNIEYNKISTDKKIENKNIYLNDFEKENISNIKKFNDDYFNNLWEKYNGNARIFALEFCKDIINKIYVEQLDNYNIYYNLENENEIYFLYKKKWYKGSSYIIKKIFKSLICKIAILFLDFKPPINDKIKNNFGEIINKEDYEKHRYDYTKIYCEINRISVGNSIKYIGYIFDNFKELVVNNYYNISGKLIFENYYDYGLTEIMEEREKGIKNKLEFNLEVS